MARYEQSYSGERLTDFIGVKVTPSLRAELEAEASANGVRLSDYVRAICQRRPPSVVAATRRNPEAKAVLLELSAIGNNLNQLTRRANIHGDLPERDDLKEALAAVKAAMTHVLDL